MNRHIVDAEVQKFILYHLNDDPAGIALQKSPFSEVSSAELASQVDGKKRSQKKLPLWHATPGIYFPPRLNMEQASSESTAHYKTALLKGNHIADLTGGFGVDSFYFARRAAQVYHIEQNEELSDIAAHNASVLGASNITFIKADSIGFLETSNLSFDTAYLDPARRIESRKVFLLKDTVPDVTACLPLLLSKAPRIVIKTSPLFDIQSGLKELSQVSEVHVVSVKNDCKELLWVIDKGFTGEPLITCAMTGPEGARTFSFYISHEKELQIRQFSDPLSYLYEPDVALMKAGGFRSIAEQYPVLKLNVNTHLYTSSEPFIQFPGRIFKVKDVNAYSSFSKDSKTRIKANVIVRNFPLEAEQVKKKQKISDGGELYLIFTTDQYGKLIVIEAERI